MSRGRALRLTVGVVLTGIGVSGVVVFEPWQHLLIGLSPDHDVTPLSWLILRILATGMILPGLTLLGWNFLGRSLESCQARLESWSRRRFLIITLSIAATARLVAVLLLPLRLYVDWAEYDKLAWLWAAHGEYTDGTLPTAWWPPGWPFFLSRLYLLFGHQPQIGIAANVLLGAATVWLTYLLIRGVWGEIAGRWAALIVASLPSQVLFANVLCSEILFTCLFLAALNVLVRVGRPPVHPAIASALAGVILGLATLTRSLTLLFPLVAVPFVVSGVPRVIRPVFFSSSKSSTGLKTRGTGPRSGVLTWLALVFGLCLITVPWIVRNHHRLGRATISTNGGVNFYIGNNPNTGLGWNDPDPTVLYLRGAASEAHDDSAGYAAGWRYIREHPDRFIYRGVLKIAFTMLSDVDPLLYDIAEAAGRGRVDGYVIAATVTQGVYLTLLLASTFGLIQNLRKRRLRAAGGTLLLGTILYWLVVHFVFLVSGRFHFPIVPIMAGLAAITSGEMAKLRVPGSPESGTNRLSVRSIP